jgi:hypothetical protein
MKIDFYQDFVMLLGDDPSGAAPQSIWKLSKMRKIRGGFLQNM